MAQTSNQQSTSPDNSDQQSTTRQKSNNQLTSQEKEFLDKAANDNMAQIQMGRIAQQKSQNPQIQQFGQTLVSDHQNAQDKLQNIAQQNNVTLPSSLDQQHQTEANRLSKLAGTQFDKEFLSSEVNGLQNALQDYKNISENAKDPAVKQYASNAVPVIQKHLNRAQDLKQNMTRTSKLGQSGSRAKASAEADTSQGDNTSQDTERTKPGAENPSDQNSDQNPSDQTQP
jgi:putative membrane protein